MLVKTLWRLLYPRELPNLYGKHCLSSCRYFNNPIFADVYIQLGVVKLPAHRLVLAAHSGYFDAALCEEFKEGQTKCFEFKEGRMQAHWGFSNTFIRDLVRMMLNHSLIHKVRVPESTYIVAKSNNVDDDQLLRDVRVYALADYFDVAALKSHSLQIFETKVRDLWVSDSFVDCIREIYRTTDDPKCMMRKCVVDTSRAHLKKLMTGSPFRDFLSDGGDFVVCSTQMGKMPATIEMMSVVEVVHCLRPVFGGHRSYHTVTL